MNQRAQRWRAEPDLPASDIIAFVVFCRLRYRLTLRDLSEIMALRGIDSLLQPELLDRLAPQDRIRTRTHFYAATPAEAGCLLLLAARSDGDGLPLGRVLGAFQGRETKDITNPQGLVGRGLATAYREAAEHHAPDRLLTDLTGERWRAEEFGVAMMSASSRAGSRSVPVVERVMEGVAA